jgi:hypothetical protein
MIPYDVSKEVLREVQEMRKMFYNEGTCMEESIFGPRETRKKLGTNAKDGGATTERGYARRWFHHNFILPC